MSDGLIHVLHVNMSIDPITGGGTAERTVQLAKALVRSGNVCTILSLDLGLTDQIVQDLDRAGVRSFFLPCLSKRFYIPKGSTRQIATVVKNVDVIHLMGHWTIINALVAICAFFYKKPYVFCPAGALPVFGRSRIFKKIYNLLVGNQIVMKASACIAITKDERFHFKPYTVAKNEVTVIPNGINPEDFLDSDGMAFRKEHGLDEAPLVMFMGRLNEIKGPDLLLEAFLALGKKVTLNCQLVFVGPDGGMLDCLKERLSKSHSTTKVSFLGYLGGNCKSQAYHAADFLVIPSRQEAMSIVVLEAGASGTPVLLTDQCGFDDVEIVGGGKVVAATIDELVLGIEYMLSLDNLHEMGERLKHYVHEQYTWDDVVLKYLDVYSRI